MFSYIFICVRVSSVTDTYVYIYIYGLIYSLANQFILDSVAIVRNDFRKAFRKKPFAQQRRYRRRYVGAACRSLRLQMALRKALRKGYMCLKNITFDVWFPLVFDL